MEEKVMGVITGTVVFITIAVCFVLMYFPNLHSVALQIHENNEFAFGRESVYETLQEEDDGAVASIEIEEVQDLLQGHQIRLKLPTNVTSKAITIENNYVNRTVDIIVKGIGKNYFDDNPMRGSSNNIVDVTYANEDMVGDIQITLDAVFEVEMTSDSEYVYFDFLEPHEIYDYVVVIDAGHGGKVPGATKMGVSEKEIDLGFVLAMKEYFDSTNKNIGVYYTRLDDSNPSFASRVGLANGSNADVFVSIHNNSTASGRMSGISGTEVMYQGADASGESKAFASTMLTHLLDGLGSKSKGTVVGDDIYIIRESKAPVALVEVGFMTNQQELKNLCDEEYQKKGAKAMYEAIIEYLYN